MTRLFLTTALWLAAAVPAPAQNANAGRAAEPSGVPAARPDEAAADPSSACETGPISHIFIDNHSIFDTSDPELDPRFEWAYDVANALHVRTRRDVVRRELLFAPGDCLDAELLQESERLLRRLDFLSRVDIFPVLQDDSSYHVVVDTGDEWSTQVDLRVRWDDGPEFEGAALRETNLLGTGQEIELFYFERDATRDYGVGYRTAQLAGTRWDLEAAAGRTRLGTFARAALAHPFVGETGRWAAKQAYGRRDRLFDYSTGGTGADERHVLLPLLDQSVDLAGVVRLGRPGAFTLIGGSLAYQEIGFPGGREAIRVVDGDDYDVRDRAAAALAEPVLPHMNGHRALRALLLLGRRSIGWVQRTGLDALKGEQDVALGTDFSLALGPSLPILGAADDLFASASFYGAAAGESALLVAHGRADGRHPLSAGSASPAVQDIIAEAELLGYWRPPALPRQTFVVRAAGAGGWNARTPFQLTLGGPRGVRGYSDESFPGGRRAVVTVEDRIYFGWPFADVLDLGGTVFLDAGRMRPADAPFGSDSGWRASAGLGLRASFPAGGRTTYRIDVAMPLGSAHDWSDARLLISVGESIGLTGDFDEPQLGRSRPHPITNGLFHFPR